MWKFDSIQLTNQLFRIFPFTIFFIDEIRNGGGKEI